MGFAGMRIALMAGSACAVSVLAAVLMLPGSSLPTAMGLRISGAHLGHHLVRDRDSVRRCGSPPQGNESQQSRSLTLAVGGLSSCKTCCGSQRSAVMSTRG